MHNLKFPNDDAHDIYNIVDNELVKFVENILNSRYGIELNNIGYSDILKIRLDWLDKYELNSIYSKYKQLIDMIINNDIREFGLNVGITDISKYKKWISTIYNGDSQEQSELEYMIHRLSDFIIKKIRNSI